MGAAGAGIVRLRVGSIFCGALCLPLVFILSACGGGGSSSSSGGTPVPPSAFVITTPPTLPGTLMNHAYSTTLQTANGKGALTWTIAAIGGQFVDGLTIDRSSGVLSGTVAFGGTAGFVATVTDSSTPPFTARKTFTVTAYSPLQSPPPQSFSIGQYQSLSTVFMPTLGGVPPLTYVVTGGSLPGGVRLNGQSGQFTGGAIALGNYAATVTIQDAFSPPEIASAQINFQVLAPTLQIANSLPSIMSLNRPFSGRVVAMGGIPPYHFALASGTMPPGLSAIDPNGGQVSGTPTTAGNYFITVSVTDSSSPPQTASNNYSININAPLGRNDTIATATLIHGNVNATISPYIDPPNGAPLPADNDYYKMVSVSGATVHVETLAQRFYGNDPLDTVIEIVDGNGARQSSCRQPGDTTTNFSSSCINDDIGGNPPVLDSALDYKVPGAPNTATTFYIHVLDWRGDARPDMRYNLQVSGAVEPLIVQTPSVAAAARMLPYTQQLTAGNAVGAVSWSVIGGILPPGITLAPSGAFSGSATTDGSYAFTVQATDSSTPPQTATAAETILVVEPVKITSPAVWPDACLNKPYSFTVQATGGAPPFQWSFVSTTLWPGFSLDQSTGTFSGSAPITGAFAGNVGVSDATLLGASQSISVTVKTCP